MDIKETARRHGFEFSKKYGQNFIGDGNLLSAIVKDAGINSSDTVIEIGAGAGTLTKELAKAAGKVVAYEIDTSLKAILDESLSGLNNVTVFFRDILKVNADEIKSLGEFRVVANLPYYITTPVIFFFLEGGFDIKSLTVMVQKEVADRICATPDKGDYGALSASVALKGKAVIKRFVDRRNFYPSPNVDSAVVHIDIVKTEGAEKAAEVVKKAFLMKRKTLLNNLISGFSLPRRQAEQIISDCGFPPLVRAEQLSTADFVTLSKRIFRKEDN